MSKRISQSGYKRKNTRQHLKHIDVRTARYDKYKLFAMNYLACKYNAREAAKKTGLAEAYGTQLIKHPLVQKILRAEYKYIRQRYKTRYRAL